MVSFARLCRLLADAVGTRSLLVPVPPSMAMIGARSLSRIMRDVILIPEEMGALMAETLISHDPPSAPTRLTSWLSEWGPCLGRTYTSELKRHWSQQESSGHKDAASSKLG